jgi:TatD DNase family protein
MLPADRLCLETDAPWCEIRPTHAGSKYVETKFAEYPSVKREKWKKGCMVKSRNEPCCIR